MACFGDDEAKLYGKGLNCYDELIDNRKYREGDDVARVDWI